MTEALTPSPQTNVDLIACEDGDISCDRCSGTGNLIKDWDRYVSAKTTEEIEDCESNCPDCSGYGRFKAEPAPPQNQAEDEHRCPICDEAFKPDDNCATDIELGTCHFDCLDGSPVVDLETGEEILDDDMHSFPYSDVMDPPPQEHVAGAKPVAWRYRGKETSDAIMGRHGEQRWQYCTAEPSLHPSWLEHTDFEPLYAAAPPAPIQAIENISAGADVGAQRVPSPQTNVAGEE